MINKSSGKKSTTKSITPSTTTSTQSNTVSLSTTNKPLHCSNDSVQIVHITQQIEKLRQIDTMNQLKSQIAALQTKHDIIDATIAEQSQSRDTVYSTYHQQYNILHAEYNTLLQQQYEYDELQKHNALLYQQQYKQPPPTNTELNVQLTDEYNELLLQRDRIIEYINHSDRYNQYYEQLQMKLADQQQINQLEIINKKLLYQQQLDELSVANECNINGTRAKYHSMTVNQLHHTTKHTNTINESLAAEIRYQQNQIEWYEQQCIVLQSSADQYVHNTKQLQHKIKLLTENICHIKNMTKQQKLLSSGIKQLQLSPVTPSSLPTIDTSHCTDINLVNDIRLYEQRIYDTQQQIKLYNITDEQQLISDCYQRMYTKLQLSHTVDTVQRPGTGRLLIPSRSEYLHNNNDMEQNESYIDIHARSCDTNSIVDDKNTIDHIQKQYTIDWCNVPLQQINTAIELYQYELQCHGLDIHKINNLHDNNHV